VSNSLSRVYERDCRRHRHRRALLSCSVLKRHSAACHVSNVIVWSGLPFDRARVLCGWLFSAPRASDFLSRNATLPPVMCQNVIGGSGLHFDNAYTTPANPFGAKEPVQPVWRRHSAVPHVLKVSVYSGLPFNNAVCYPESCSQCLTTCQVWSETPPTRFVYGTSQHGPELPFDNPRMLCRRPRFGREPFKLSAVRMTRVDAQRLSFCLATPPCRRHRLRMLYARES